MTASPPATTSARARLVTGLAVVASLGLHALLVLGLATVPFLAITPPIPIEVLPFKKRPPAPPAIEPPAEKPKPRESKPVQPKPRPVSDAGKTPAKPPPPPADDLRAVGPQGANITIILRGPALARSPHRDGVDQLLSMLPDYHTLLDGTGLHPFDDLDALLISTPDPRDVSSTFLAARHRVDPRFDRIPSHKLGAGDPRQFRALTAELMLLGRPEDLARIERAEQAGGAPEGELAEAARWLGALRQFDAGSKEAAFQLTIADLPQLVRLRGGDLPLPRTIRLAMSAEASPAVRLLCLFDDEAQSARFAATWPEVRVQLRESAPMFAGSLDDLKLTRRGKEVELLGTLPESRVRLALGLVQMFAPRRAPAPAQPPESAQPGGAPTPADPE